MALVGTEGFCKKNDSKDNGLDEEKLNPIDLEDRLLKDRINECKFPSATANGSSQWYLDTKLSK